MRHELMSIRDTDAIAATRIPSLDGIRAGSIALVLIGHAAGTKNCYSEASIQPFGDVASLGVRIFFVISGFLITSLLLEEMDRYGTISIARFYLRRTLRIFPAFYAFVLTVSLLSACGIVRLAPGDLPYALTYTMNYHEHHSWPMAHIWSLSVEEQFYLLWPAGLLIAGRRKGLVLAAFFVVVAPVVRMAIWYGLPDERVGASRWFPAVADAIATGCVLAATRGWLGRQAIYQALLRPAGFVPLLCLTAVIAMKDGGRLRLFLLDGVLNILIAIIIDRCVRTPGDWLGRILNSRPLVRLGVMSYSVYLWQQLFLNRHSPGLLTSFPLNLVTVIVVAYLSYRWIERPLLDVRKQIENRVFGLRRTPAETSCASA